MIFKGSSLIIADNCGAKLSKCLMVMNKVRYGNVGSTVLVTLKKFIIITMKKKVKKKLIYVGIVVTVSYLNKRHDGFYLKFFSNKILIFTRQLKFLGTRVFGIIDKQFRHCIYMYSSIKINYKAIGYSCVTI
jgi:ribosomal protein L14